VGQMQIFISAEQSRTLTADIGHGLKMEMVVLPGGEFTMGGDADNSERPRHQVRVSPFAIGKSPVTQAQWKAVMGDNNNPSKHKGDNLPVENVSWHDVGKFLKKAGQAFRLPTEAEWEYAARGWSSAEYCFGDDKSLLAEYAWFDKNSEGKTHPVGEKKPNPFGLHDMHGNVWEWCSDWYGNRYYAECRQQGIVTDPTGPGTGIYRVRRGGSWSNYAVDCRSASRYNDTPGDHYSDLGFRLVASVFGSM